MESLEQTLTEHPFLEGLEPQHFEFIASCSRETNFEVNQYILREGEESDQFYLICEGRVVLRSSCPGRHYTTIHTLESGDIVGWSWLIPPHHCQFSAQVTRPTKAITIDGKCLRDKCEQDHDFGYELQKRLGAVIGEMLEMTKMRLG